MTLEQKGLTKLHHLSSESNSENNRPSKQEADSPGYSDFCLSIQIDLEHSLHTAHAPFNEVPEHKMSKLEKPALCRKLAQLYDYMYGKISTHCCLPGSTQHERFISCSF